MESAEAPNHEHSDNARVSVANRSHNSQNMMLAAFACFTTIIAITIFVIGSRVDVRAEQDQFGRLPDSKILRADTLARIDSELTELSELKAEGDARITSLRSEIDARLRANASQIGEVEAEIHSLHQCLSPTRDFIRDQEKVAYYRKHSGLSADASDEETIEAFVQKTVAQNGSGDRYQLQKNLKNLFEKVRSWESAAESVRGEIGTLHRKLDGLLQDQQLLADHKATVDQEVAEIESRNSKINAQISDVKLTRLSIQQEIRIEYEEERLRVKQIEDARRREDALKLMESVTAAKQRAQESSKPQVSSINDVQQSWSPAFQRTPGSRYEDPTYRPQPSLQRIEGYERKDGVMVRGHYRTERDDSFWNNFSSDGNINPFTGVRGSRRP